MLVAIIIIIAGEFEHIFLCLLAIFILRITYW